MNVMINESKAGRIFDFCYFGKKSTVVKSRDGSFLNSIKLNVYYRTINGLSQANKISFSLYACSCWCCWSISIFLRLLRAKVALLRCWTSSTRPNPPTPKVPICFSSFNRTWLNSDVADTREAREIVWSTILVLRIISRLPKWASKALWIKLNKI